MYRVLNQKFRIWDKGSEKSSLPADLLSENSSLYYVSWISTRFILLQARAEFIGSVGRKVLTIRKILSK